jgi:hyperosmotically inducible periplasmic protein
MHMRKRLVWLALLIIISVGLLSCRTSAGRSAGQVWDDGAITTEVKTKLLADGMMKGMAITVSTFEGNVTMIGAVDSRDQKARAEQIAKSAKGVRSVNNLVEVKKM